MKGGAFEIAGRKIGGGRTFVIAEAGTNHDGSLDKAREMVRIAADCPLICPTVVDATIAGHFASGCDYTMNDVPRTFPRFPTERLCVDTREDFEVVKSVIENVHEEKRYMHHLRVLEFLASNPAIAALNAGVRQKVATAGGGGT